MHRLVSSFIAASLLLSPLSAIAKPKQESNANSLQSDLGQHPSVCEHVRITLNSGRKIESDLYRHQRDQIEIKLKGAIQTIPDKDIKRIELRQGSCPNIKVTLKTGEQVEGYRRDHNCHDRNDCRTEIRKRGKVLVIADSDIKTVALKFKTTFREKLKNAALIPVIPFSYLILLILCGRGGCNDL